MRTLTSALCLVVASSGLLLAQGADRLQPAPAERLLTLVRADASQPPATVTFFNRPIVDLRATVLGRSPAERAAARSGLLDAASLRSSRLLELQRWLVSGVYAALCLLMTYVTVGFVLRRFAYTRPWGDSMRGFLVGTAEQLGLGIFNAVPG